MSPATRSGVGPDSLAVDEVVDPLSSPLLRRASIGAFFALALLALGVLWLNRPVQTESQKLQPPSQGGHLEQVLIDLRRTWIPNLRQKMAVRARADASSLGPSLVGVLSDSSSPFLEEAVFLAKNLGGAEMLAPLRAMVRGGPPRLRPAALLAAERIAPWAMSELCEFFDSPLEGVVTAAVEIAAARVDAPFEKMLALLEHKAAPVRSTVLVALPTPLPRELTRALLARARASRAVPEAAVITALGRGADLADAERYLYELLDHPDARTRMVTMNALGQKHGPLRDAGTIRAMICDGTRSVHERAVAIHCLERTATLEGLDQLLELPANDPVMDYALGRCLVTRLDPRGYGRILQAIEARSSEIPAQLMNDVQLEARILIGRLSGEGQYASLERLHAWEQKAKAVVPMPLGLSALGRS